MHQYKRIQAFLLALRCLTVRILELFVCFVKPCLNRDSYSIVSILVIFRFLSFTFVDRIKFCPCVSVCRFLPVLSDFVNVCLFLVDL